MNILLVSECSKNALKRTRQIVDQFAERKGSRTWQTHITAEGLRTLKSLLRKTARKNTAVACHWIRGRNHSELLWLVGNASRFNQNGTVPTDTSRRDVLRRDDENDWKSLETIRLLSALAALFHDVGKANDAFQKKLKHNRKGGDAFRHEWVSLRIFEAFVEQDDDTAWLERLAGIRPETKKYLLSEVHKDGGDRKLRGPFKGLPPLAQAVGWLIVSHHRLPYSKQRRGAPNPKGLAKLPSGIPADWYATRPSQISNFRNGKDNASVDPRNCWQFAHPLPFESVAWCVRAQKVARRMLQNLACMDLACVGDSYVMHLSRLSLTLADHYYSSLSDVGRREKGDANPVVYANTRRKTDGEGVLNQALDEHLIGVEKCAARIVHSLPRLPHELPRLARHTGFKKRSKDRLFRWQDQAFDLACGLRDRSAKQGFFGVNMASTGCGKTLGNGRIMYGLSNPVLGTRFSIALGLRTLTLQTGDVYRHLMSLGPDDLAVLVGGGAWRDLYGSGVGLGQDDESQQTPIFGSESAADLMDGSSYVHYEGEITDNRIRSWVENRRGALSLLNAPVLVCTIDHLMPATESLAGGHQIAPMMRLMSSDLILDEPDDFGIEDLYALSRLVHLAGCLGARVLLSSATLPPAIVEGLFNAYRAGRDSYRKNHEMPDRLSPICCAWFDEYTCEEGTHEKGTKFMQQHRQWVSKRVEQLKHCDARRRGRIVAIRGNQGEAKDLCLRLAEDVLRFSKELHAMHNVVDSETSSRLSFGLLRMANISPLVQLTHALAALDVGDGVCLHICCYHSQHPLFVRSAIEKRLDSVLNRENPNSVFKDSAVRRAFTCKPGRDHIFLVLATPVAEVGRDHDYDWAIVEPSSMRSMIQVAGRVRRHRSEAVEVPNMYLLDQNVKSLKKGMAEPAFCRPGFETKEFALNSHTLSDLLRKDQYSKITAIPRILETGSEAPGDNLCALEHDHLRAVMVGDSTAMRRAASVDSWWSTQAWLSGELQRAYPFRKDIYGRIPVALRYSAEEEKITFVRIEVDGTETEIGDSLIHGVDVEFGQNVYAWGEMDYIRQLEDLAVMMGTDPEICAQRFGTVELPKYGEEHGWSHNETLGFWKEY